MRSQPLLCLVVVTGGQAQQDVAEEDVRRDVLLPLPNGDGCKEVEDGVEGTQLVPPYETAKASCLRRRVGEETNQEEEGEGAEKEGRGDTRSQPDQETEEESDRYADEEVKIHPSSFGSEKHFILLHREDEHEKEDEKVGCEKKEEASIPPTLHRSVTMDCLVHRHHSRRRYVSLR